MIILNDDDKIKFRLLIKALKLKLSAGEWLINDEMIDQTTIDLLQRIVDDAEKNAQ